MLFSMGRTLVEHAIWPPFELCGEANLIGPKAKFFLRLLSGWNKRIRSTVYGSPSLVISNVVVPA